jgi:hypothetical protein
MITELERRKLRKDALVVLELTTDLKATAIDTALKTIKTILQKHKSIEVIALKSEGKRNAN